MTNYSGVTYPINTGAESLDKALAEQAQAEFTTRLQAGVDGNCPTAANDNIHDQRVTFTATGAGSKFLSLIYTTFDSYPLDAHPVTNYKAVIYDLETQKTVELSELFANTGQVAPGLWALIAQGWCAQGHGSVPSHYDVDGHNAPCDPNTPPLPESFKASPLTFGALGQVTLTPRGLTITLDPYSAWSYADGVGVLELAKEDLLKLGANRDIWKTKK
jgi:hypothetical protein